MSKKYQYFAKKRNSGWYIEAKNPCKHKKPHNLITCKVCLGRAGRTRRQQVPKEDRMIVIGNNVYYTY